MAHEIISLERKMQILPYVDLMWETESLDYENKQHFYQSFSYGNNFTAADLRHINPCLPHVVYQKLNDYQIHEPQLLHIDCQIAKEFVSPLVKISTTYAGAILNEIESCKEILDGQIYIKFYDIAKLDPIKACMKKSELFPLELFSELDKMTKPQSVLLRIVGDDSYRVLFQEIEEIVQDIPQYDER